MSDGSVVDSQKGRPQIGSTARFTQAHFPGSCWSEGDFSQGMANCARRAVDCPQIAVSGTSLCYAIAVCIRIRIRQDQNQARFADAMPP